MAINNGYKVTLLAGSYYNASTGVHCVRPWETTIREGSPALENFRGNPCFKIEPTYIPDVVIPVVEETTTKEKSKGGKEVPLGDVPEIRKDIKEKLIEEGYTTVQELLEAGTVEELVKISGIGEATANAVRESCEKYLKHLEESEDEEDEEDE